MTATLLGRRCACRARSTTRNPVLVAFAEVPDTLGLLAWIFKDALIAALDREIDAESDDAAALSHEERQQREAEAIAQGRVSAGASTPARPDGGKAAVR